jgi:transcriptional regulator with XRE-family HTH domain
MRATLGRTLKRRREALGLSQRALAKMLGVKASHVGYLEAGRRRPSLALLRRLAETLGLEKAPLFLLARPEARDLIAAQDKPRPAPPRGAAWSKFVRNRQLLNRHGVTPRELRVLEQVNLLGKVSSPRNFLFILNSIRQAVENG